MTTMTTTEAKAKMLCPLARTFGDPSTKTCRADGCAIWRFLPIMADDALFKSAVQREIALMTAEAEKQVEAGARKTVPSRNLLHTDAVKRVAADPQAYNVPSHHHRGYCGLGGKP